MSRKRYYGSGGSSEYQQGYMHGRIDSKEDASLNAYYAGVGYGKREHGDEHLGFVSDKERRQFEEGIKNKDKHFNAYRLKPLSLWERIFGRKDTAKQVSYTSGKTRKKRLKKARKKARKAMRKKKR